MRNIKQISIGLCSFVLALCLIFTPKSGLAFEGSVETTDIFAKGYIEVIGESESGQRRYAAIRAATVVAQRNLLEAIKEIRVEGETTVADGMLQNDAVRSRVAGFLRGARVCGRKYHAQERYGEVCLRVNLKGNGGVYASLYNTLEQEKIVTTGGDAPLSPQPVMPENAIKVDSNVNDSYDGVIIELAGHSFKPAIVNRILNQKGDILFDPSKVINSILIDRGTGGFTNKLGKAKGLLASWNGVKPLMINAVGTRQGTDAVISNRDAKTLFAADQNNSFLSQAKVVFVIN
ncbi:MAG: hypothetical protein HQL71_09585 [Magnetococcales bacterium]|nr:hypothetical protein [Magnetococcales bacterium]